MEKEEEEEIRTEPRITLYRKPNEANIKINKSSRSNIEYAGLKK